MKLTKDQFISKLINEAAIKDINITKKKAEKLYLYKELLLEWNEKINLTAITDDEEIIQKHIIDCLVICKYIDNNKSIIDVGTGAGLPGVIISIYFEGEVNITLLDALDKRIKFLQTVIDTLDLKNTTAVHGRAEELGRKDEYREKYNIIVSRAVAPLNILIELTIPLLNINGEAIYMKAEKSTEELQISSNAIKELSLQLCDNIKYKLKLDTEELSRNLLIFKKKEITKEKFPRLFAKIKTKPL